MEESFETGPAPRVDGVPIEPDRWGGDYSEVVGELNGVKPATGAKMFRFLRGDYEGRSLPNSFGSDVCRLIDVRPYRHEFAAGDGIVQLSALFNSAAFAQDRGFECTLTIFALDAEIVNNQKFIGKVEDMAKVFEAWDTSHRQYVANGGRALMDDDRLRILKKIVPQVLLNDLITKDFHDWQVAKEWVLEMSRRLAMHGRPSKPLHLAEAEGAGDTAQELGQALALLGEGATAEEIFALKAALAEAEASWCSGQRETDTWRGGIRSDCRQAIADHQRWPQTLQQLRKNRPRQLGLQAA